MRTSSNYDEHLRKILPPYLKQRICKDFHEAWKITNANLALAMAACQFAIRSEYWPVTQHADTSIT